MLQLGSDPHVILEDIAVYKPCKSQEPVCVPMQLLLNMRECCHKYLQVLDENYHLHGQLEKVKARYIYKVAQELVNSKCSLEEFLRQWPIYCCHQVAQYPFMVNGCVVFKSYCECKCATTVVPQLFLDQAKKEMEGDGLEWF